MNEGLHPAVLTKSNGVSPSCDTSFSKEGPHRCLNSLSWPFIYQYACMCECPSVHVSILAQACCEVWTDELKCAPHNQISLLL